MLQKTCMIVSQIKIQIQMHKKSASGRFTYILHLQHQREHKLQFQEEISIYLLNSNKVFQ
jgi:hypothetical protein